MAVGAYTSALLTAPVPKHWGGLSCIAIGWAGRPPGGSRRCAGDHLRLRHDYAIATFGIAVTIQLVALNFVKLTNGPSASLPFRVR